MHVARVVIGRVEEDDIGFLIAICLAFLTLDFLHSLGVRQPYYFNPW